MISLAINRREKVSLGAFLAVAAVGAFYVLVHQPLALELEEGRTRVQAVADALQKDRSRLKKEGDLAVREASVQARELAISTLMPGRHAAAVFVHFLSKLEQQSGVQIRSLRAGDRKANGELVEVAMELEADGTFPSHILFQQNLQTVPLFFSLQTWKLDSNRTGTIARAGELVQQGRPWEAEALLRDHPRLKGLYRVHVYFRPQQQGPDPAAVGAMPAAGRPDPFVGDLIDEFFSELQKAYGGSGPGLVPGAQPPVPWLPSPAPGPGGPPSAPPGRPAQLG